jgi:hypothetical protein
MPQGWGRSQPFPHRDRGNRLKPAIGLEIEEGLGAAAGSFSTEVVEALRQSLLDSTGNRGEYVIGAGSDHSNGTHDNRENDRQHDGVFGDILAFLLPQHLPQPARNTNHG